MWYPHGAAPDPGPLIPGYLVRSYEEGDQDGWVDLLNANGQLGQWDRERIQREIDGALVREGQKFAFWEGTIVAAAGVYSRLRNGREAWEIGWVAVHPEHRRRNLGRQVTAAAVAAALRLLERPIFLLTDDGRIPALKVYLELGFVPEFGDPSYAGRWRRIFAELGGKYSRYRLLLPEEGEEGNQL
jgi:mycothiol synthase